MSDVYVISIDVRNQPLHPRKRGAAILRAYVGLMINGIRLLGCALIEMPNGTWSLSPPRLEGLEDKRRCVQIADAGLRSEVVAVSREAYDKLRGASSVRGASTNSSVTPVAACGMQMDQGENAGRLPAFPHLSE